MSGVSSSSSPNCRSMRSRASKRCASAEINEAKKILATEATAMVHGRAAAEQAAETARQTFEEGTLAESLPSVAIAAKPSSKPASACSRPSSKRGLSPRRAKRGGR